MLDDDCHWTLTPSSLDINYIKLWHIIFYCSSYYCCLYGFVCCPSIFGFEGFVCFHIVCSILFYYNMLLFIIINIGRTYPYRLTFTRASSARPSRQLGFSNLLLFPYYHYSLSSPLEVVLYAFILHVVTA